MARKWQNGQVVAIQNLAPQTKQFFLKLDSTELLSFQPGQFITCDLPIHEKRNKRWKSYSIANVPSLGHPLIELCVVRLPGGLASDYFFEEVKIGTEITFKGPAGVFVYPSGFDQTMVMICTGTGVAPFRSMLLKMREDGPLKHAVHLIFGTRNREGLLYREEMEQLASVDPNFTYTVVLSRDPDWQGYQGHVHQVYEEHYKKVSDGVHFYLCGWSMMIDEARKKLVDKMGYDRSQIRFERYG